ncbi:MAG: hypothetical protein WBZ40_13860 [Acidimicrobiia bacterium]
MKWFAWVLAVSILLGTPLVLIVAGTPDQLGTDPLQVAAQVAYITIAPIFALTSAIILSQQPKNMVGWTLMGIALGFVISIVADVSASALSPYPADSWYVAMFPDQAHGFLSPDVVDGWLVTRALLASFSWILFVFPLFHLLMTFPTGRLLSPRWRILAGLEGLMMLTMIFLGTFSAQVGVEGSWAVPNPIGFISVNIFDGPFDTVWSFGLLVLTVAGPTAMVLRYRRAGTVERLQIKWLLYAVGLFALVYGGSAVQSGDSGSLFDLMFPISVAVIGIAIAMAVLRYRLYEIDRIISRTVGYVLVIGFLAMVYVTGAVWLPTRLGGDSPLFVAGSTLAVAALFNPVRRRLLHWVDRRFYRTRYNAERVVDGFVDSLRNRTDLDGLAAEWVAAVTETMQPASIGIWVRG